jgi:hypothetical protein
MAELSSSSIFGFADLELSVGFANLKLPDRKSPRWRGRLQCRFGFSDVERFNPAHAGLGAARASHVEITGANPPAACRRLL